MKYVAFIGSRDLAGFEGDRVTLYRSAVVAAVRHGYAVVTGACAGAEQIAAETALEAGGKVLLVLPYRWYERGWIHTVEVLFPGRVRYEVYEEREHPRWKESVRLYHPEPRLLGAVTTRMHARSFGVVGRAVSVVAMPSFKNQGGGVAQGLRIAAALEIKAFDLREPAQCAALMQRLVRKA